MERIRTTRDSLGEFVARLQGTRNSQPQIVAAQQRSHGRLSRIVTLPEVILDPIQDLDVDSDTFGQTFWTLDLDGLE